MTKILERYVCLSPYTCEDNDGIYNLLIFQYCKIFPTFQPDMQNSLVPYIWYQCQWQTHTVQKICSTILLHKQYLDNKSVIYNQKICCTRVKALDEKLVCSKIFLAVAQAFCKVWHEKLVYKINRMLPRHYTDLLRSYVSDRVFRIKRELLYRD